MSKRALLAVVLSIETLGMMGLARVAYLAGDRHSNTEVYQLGLQDGVAEGERIQRGQDLPLSEPSYPADDWLTSYEKFWNTEGHFLTNAPLPPLFYENPALDPNQADPSVDKHALALRGLPSPCYFVEPGAVHDSSGFL